MPLDPQKRTEEGKLSCIKASTVSSQGSMNLINQFRWNDMILYFSHEIITMLVIYSVSISACAICLILQWRTIEFCQFGFPIFQPLPGLLWVSDFSTQWHIIKSSDPGRKYYMNIEQDLSLTQSLMSKTIREILKVNSLGTSSVITR